MPGPGSLRLGFAISLLPPPPHRWQAAVELVSRPIPVCPGIQKTFSAGPRSFNSIEFWFPGARFGRSGVQPVFDSRHGRITAKCFPGRSFVSREPPLPIKPQGSVSNPFRWFTATLKFIAISLRKFFTENRRLQSTQRAQCPTPLLVRGGSHQFISSWPLVPETSGWRRTRSPGA